MVKPHHCHDVDPQMAVHHILPYHHRHTRGSVGGSGSALTTPSVDQCVACQRAARRAAVSLGLEGTGDSTWDQTVNC